MRILHTADWHLGDRLGRIDRTDDLRRAVERVALYCLSEKADVLLVAGDLFSELAGPDGLREAIRHLQLVFEEFLAKGGTILTLTGNHDKENFCQTLRHAMSLAAPLGGKAGALAQPGRLYLATEPTLLRLADPAGSQYVQFILMPYPTPARYLADEAAQRYQNLEEKNRHLMSAYTRSLHAIREGPGFQADLPTVLSAHIHVHGSQLPNLFRLSEEEDVVFAETDLPEDFAYIGLGHIHRAQFLRGQGHIRYSGSIEKMDLGESTDEKGVVVVDIGPEGRRGEVRVLPLESTAIYVVPIFDPRAELSTLTQRYPDCQRALVRIECTYRAGIDNREETLRELDRIFPRWYDRQITEASSLTDRLAIGEPARGKSFEDTVRDYLRQELTNHEDVLRETVLARAEEMMREVQQ
jgi:DNA repair protein SbcD/Mre11